MSALATSVFCSTKEFLRYLCSNFRLFVAAPLVEVDEETDEENFLLWRLEKGVAEGSTEIPKGKS